MTSLMCLAVAIFFEARSEPLAGQYAVGQVILNRVEDSRYPDDVCSVVFEPNQFSFTKVNHKYSLPKDSVPATIAISVASDLLYNVTYPINSTHYHTLGVDPYWNKDYIQDNQIGNHIFYTNNTRYR